MEAAVLAQRLDAVRAALENASEGRYPTPKLIAVTKTHPLEDILPLKALGVTDVGENRVQEIMEQPSCSSQSRTNSLLFTGSCSHKIKQNRYSLSKIFGVSM